MSYEIPAILKKRLTSLSKDDKKLVLDILGEITRDTNPHYGLSYADNVDERMAGFEAALGKPRQPKVKTPLNNTLGWQIGDL